MVMYRSSSGSGEVLRMDEGDPARTLGEPWREAMLVFDRELSALGVAEGTRRAYASDLGRLARWAGERRLEPARDRPS